MYFRCGDCGERSRIVGFRPAGTVPHTFGIKRHVPLCMDCFRKEVPAKKVVPAIRDQWSPVEREPGCDDEYPF